MKYDWQEIVLAIQKVVNEIKKNYLIENDVLRDYVFEILEKHCVVLYYPLKDEKSNGFHTKKIVKDELKDFVYINTAKPLELQVFTAAHEMGHVWQVAQKVWKDLGYDEQGLVLEEKIEENITNRFAAELLMPEKTFVKIFYQKKSEMRLTGASITVDDLLRITAILMNTFLVQYDAIRKRLFETGIINETGKKLLKDNHKEYRQRIQIYAKDQNSLLERASYNKTIPGIRELIEQVEMQRSMSGIVINKIKKDFGIEDLKMEDDTLEILRTNGEAYEKEGTGGC